MLTSIRCLIRSFRPVVLWRNAERACQTSKEINSCEEENSSDPDMFISDTENPFERGKHICILCKYNIPLDYKNPRLLSQFISPYTGFVYGKHITGLCDAQQKRLLKAIKQSQDSGYMPMMIKAAKYLRDPKLFDPFSPSRKNPY